MRMITGIMVMTAMLAILQGTAQQPGPAIAGGKRHTAVQGRQPVDYVNPFIGASTNAAAGNNLAGLGKTFPGAATPFGMTQLSPNTITGGDNGSGYSYEHTSIEGFAMTQMSGVGWYGDLGNFLVTPSVGTLKTSVAGYRSDYDKKSETASAGYYAVTLKRGSIRCEMTAAPHSGIMRFTFHAAATSRIQIDLARRVGGTSVLQYVKLVNDSTLEGWMKCTPDGGGWGDGAGHANYTVYFCARCSKPFRHFGVWSADVPEQRKREDVTSAAYQETVAQAALLPGVTEKEGRHLGFYTEFATKEDEPVLLKTGISFVSMEGASHNLDTEIKGFDFDGIHRQARESWNKALSVMTVGGGSEEEKTCFYTALYHTLLDPRTCADVDGSYPGGDGRPHQATGFTKRTIFSGWDVFRSQMPLQTMINPGVVSDLINSLVTLAEENGKGYFDRWELLNAYSGCMVGNPAISVVADAYVKKLKGFDVVRAQRVSLATSEQFGNGTRGFSGGENSISNTLEYAYTDWCLSQLLAGLGHTDEAKEYYRRGQDYKNVFDKEKDWFRPRKEDGSWEPWPVKGRLEEGYGTVESNPYQQGWFVPQDIPGMIALMGGREKVLADLESFFEKTPENMLWNEYYNHANEPVHHVAFLFNYLGAPWLTQRWTRLICQRAYHNAVEGLVGNDDVGQMSAWYVLAASGLYPVCPGSTRYEITSPVFNNITIHTGAGSSFRVVARNNSPSAVYIQGAKLNGKPYDNCFIDYRDIMAGGELELTMGEKPAKSWGNNAAVAEPGNTVAVAPPYFSTRGALNRFYMDVLERKAVTVGFLGGSITYNPGWRDKVCGYLQERFPDTKFRFIAAGIPSLGSLPHAFRVQQDLLDSGRVDVVFVETAVNDRVNGTDSLTQTRALEGIVRQIKNASHDAGIIMMAFADEDKTADYDRGLTPVEIINQERVADHYNLPSINLGGEVWDRIRQGKLNWKQDFKDVHPSEFGQELYFATIRRLLDSCYKLYRPVASASGSLPAPMDRACLSGGRYVDVHKGVGDKDWMIDEDWTPADNVPTRPGFVHVPVLAAEKPGAALELPFSGNAIGIAVVSGPDAGTIEYSIDGGMVKKIDLYTKWSSGLHLPWYLLLGSGLTETSHTLRLRVSEDRDPKSKGTACRIVHFLLNTR